VEISRRFQLVAAMNPCPADMRRPHWTLPLHAGTDCALPGRISGPLADRIDIKLEVPAPRDSELVARSPGVLRSIRGRVEARPRPADRPPGKAQLLLTTREIDRHARPIAKATSCFAMRSRACSFRRAPYHRVLRVARSIADLAGKSTIGSEHIAEAIQYRRLDASF